MMDLKRTSRDNTLQQPQTTSGHYCLAGIPLLLILAVSPYQRRNAANEQTRFSVEATCTASINRSRRSPGCSNWPSLDFS
jgi:hypothetical protein